MLTSLSTSVFGFLLGYVSANCFRVCVLHSLLQPVSFTLGMYHPAQVKSTPDILLGGSSLNTRSQLVLDTRLEIDRLIM